MTSPFVQLSDRKLWADGVSEASPEKAVDLLQRGVPAAKLAVTELTPDILEFNRLVDTPLGLKQELSKAFPAQWVLPDRYKYLDLAEYLIGLAEHVEQDRLYEQRLQRLVEEIDLYTKLGYQDLLRTLIYIVDELNRQQVVWGVGRGSSCSSYLLYLLGLHEVDSVKFDIPISDFIREPQESKDAQDVPFSARRAG